MKLGDFSPGSFAFDFLARAIQKRREKRQRRKRERDAAGGEFLPDDKEDDMGEQFFGALKSKTVWLGIAQILYSLFEAYSNGGLNAEAVTTAISGTLTVIFRARTSESLADKGAK